MIDGFKDILLPMDFSEQGDRASQYADWFVRVCGATVHLAHVIVNPADPIYELEDQLNWIMVEAAKEKAVNLLQEAADRLLPAGCSRQFHVAVGDPFGKLMEIAQTIKADLIVMSTRGRGGVAHLMLGSVAAKTIRFAPCPVFVVRQRVLE